MSCTLFSRAIWIDKDSTSLRSGANPNRANHRIVSTRSQFFRACHLKGRRNLSIWKKLNSLEKKNVVLPLQPGSGGTARIEKWLSRHLTANDSPVDEIFMAIYGVTMSRTNRSHHIQIPSNKKKERMNSLNIASSQVIIK